MIFHISMMSSTVVLQKLEGSLIFQVETTDQDGTFRKLKVYLEHKPRCKYTSGIQMMLLGEAIGVKKLTNDCIATLYRRSCKQSIQTMHYNYYYLKSAMDKRWIESVVCEKRKELLISTMPCIVVLATVCLSSRCEKQL